MSSYKELNRFENKQKNNKKPRNKKASSLSPLPHLTRASIYGVTSDFTRLIMKINYVCHGCISPYANFQNNRIM